MFITFPLCCKVWVLLQQLLFRMLIIFPLCCEIWVVLQQLCFSMLIFCLFCRRILVVLSFRMLIFCLLCCKVFINFITFSTAIRRIFLPLPRCRVSRKLLITFYFSILSFKILYSLCSSFRPCCLLCTFKLFNCFFMFWMLLY